MTDHPLIVGGTISTRRYSIVIVQKSPAYSSQFCLFSTSLQVKGHSFSLIHIWILLTAIARQTDDLKPIDYIVENRSAAAAESEAVSLCVSK